jgi:hypothetical protein
MFSLCVIAVIAAIFMILIAGIVIAFYKKNRLGGLLGCIALAIFLILVYMLWLSQISTD